MRESLQRYRYQSFHAILLVIGTGGMTLVGAFKIVPLSASPSAPPHGIELGWAGQQLRGYSETAYITAGDCENRTSVVVNLYSTGIAPASEYPPVKASGRVAFAVAWDEGLAPSDVKVWAVSERSNLRHRLLRGDQRNLPPSLNVELEELYEAGTDSRIAISFDFFWDPTSKPQLLVKLDTDWLSPRTGNDSCWLRVPALVDTPEAGAAANRALDHEEWASSSYLGFPLYNAAALVNSWQPRPLRVEPGTSIPAPSRMDPAIWACGGQDFAAASCQAAAVLEEPGRALARTRELALWSAIGGLFLALVGAGLVGALRTFLLGEPSPD